MAQKTAVELLIAELKKWSVYESSTSYTFKVPLNVFVRMEMEAKEVEKRQTIDAVRSECIYTNRQEIAEHYYNETYGTDKTT
jgi:hypothetical protein